MNVIIDMSLAGKPLRTLLQHHLSLSAKMIARLKRHEHGIMVNGQRVTVRYVLQEGDEVILLTENTDAEDRTSKIRPVSLPLDILYEDDSILLLNKPAYMPTHTSHGHYEDTLSNAVAYYYQQKGQPFVFRPINRLDRNTSGLVLTAKHKLSAAFLSSAMQTGQIQKTYIAILDGEMTDKTGTIQTYMRRTGDSVITREVCDPCEQAEWAITDFEILATCSQYSVVCARPRTGRTHQLRVHFSHVGHPICGDTLYGSTTALIGRQALHARSLTFPDPHSHQLFTFKAPLPDDMLSLIQTLTIKESEL